MNPTLYIIILVLTGLTSSLVTMYLPALKNGIRRVLDKFKRPDIRQMVKDEVEKQLKEIIND